MSRSAASSTSAVIASIRHARAVVAALDDELARQASALAAPIPRVALSPQQRASVESARNAVEESLRTLEVAAADAAAAANDWRRKAELARAAGNPALVNEASRRAREVEEEHAAYAREVGETRAFLYEWSVRMAQGTP